MKSSVAWEFEIKQKTKKNLYVSTCCCIYAGIWEHMKIRNNSGQKSGGKNSNKDVDSLLCNFYGQEISLMQSPFIDVP